MKFIVEVDVENAAFEDHMDGALKSVLVDLADRIESRGASFDDVVVLRDRYGNRVGTARFTDRMGKSLNKPRDLSGNTGKENDARRIARNRGHRLGEWERTASGGSYAECKKCGDSVSIPRGRPAEGVALTERCIG